MCNKRNFVALGCSILTGNFSKFKPANKVSGSFKFKNRPDTQNDRGLCCFENDPDHSHLKAFLLKFNATQDQRNYLALNFSLSNLKPH